MWQTRQGKMSSDGPALSFRSCPAKTFQNSDGITIAGRSVVEHCQIVGEVARALISNYPPNLQKILFPENAHFAVACHDIGKVSPCFVEKIRRACTPDHNTIPAFAGINPDVEHQWGGHAGVSQVTAKAVNAPDYVAEILGQHHGFSPNVAGRKPDTEVFGGAPWLQEREALIAELKSLLHGDWPEVETASKARLLAGLTSVSDWIGSGQFFEDPALPWQDNIKRAVSDAGFVSREYQSGLSFEDIFGFKPRAAQSELVGLATEPGVYVLEAPMGLGKTEAALYAAYGMLDRKEACGIYFALPTQLTSNKIHDRFNVFIQRILAADCPHRSLLLHSQAWLRDTEMGEDGGPGGAWFNNTKRGLLAPFAVGTIDQALMAAMNVKHGFVRAFGLAGKVVILDEVHSYDAYTGALLDALVGLLRSLHCTVIILSATLNRERRAELTRANLASDAYPLITAIPNHGPLVERAVPTEDRHQPVSLCLRKDDSTAVQEALDRAATGQQVLWIENTVGDAQKRYLDLAARAHDLGLSCGLLHSRFTADDRQCIEDHWVNLFGKPGYSARSLQGRILVGTQVLEQSLDIDADFLVSRFAPTDMLLQRLGRLWRHKGTPRATSAICEAWLLAPDLDQAISAPQDSFGATAFVYDSYVLCRSLEVWREIKTLRLPEDIRPLIEKTYAQRAEDGFMARWLHELENGTRFRTGRKALRQLAMNTLAKDGKTLPEHKAQTRYRETDAMEVLLLRGLTQVPEQKASRLTLLDGEQLMLPHHRGKLGKPEWRKLGARLMRQIVSVRPQDAPLQLPLSTLKNFYLQHCFYLGNPEQDEVILRVALVDESGSLKGLQGARLHEKYSLDYRDDLGYRVIKS